MNISKKDFLATEAYKKNNRAFPHPAKIIDLLDNGIPGKSWKLNSIEVDKNGGAETKDHEKIDTWGRGFICYVNDEVYGVSGEVISLEIGILWSYDTSKEFISVLSGARIEACLNLSVISAENITTLSLSVPGSRSATGKKLEKMYQRKEEDILDDVSDAITDILKNTNSLIESHISFIKKMKDININCRNIPYVAEEDVVVLPDNVFFGEFYLHYVLMGKYDYSTFNMGCQLLFDKYLYHEKKDLYYVKEDQALITLWQVYGAMTQRITDRKVNLDDVGTKTLEITETFQNLLKTFNIDDNE